MAPRAALGLPRTLLRRPVSNGDNHHRGEIQPGPAFFRKRRTLDSPTYIPVLLILIAMAVGSVGAFFILPPLLDRIDRVGKVGIFGF
jgi:hypothetical protein